MAKTVLVFAAFAAFLVATAFAKGEAEANSSQGQYSQYCQRELQESSLNACRRVLDQRLTGRFMGSSTGMRLQCCQQLQDVSPTCRCAAIRRLVRNYEQELGEQQGSQEQQYYGEGPQEEREGYFGRAGGREEERGEGYYGRPGGREEQGEGYCSRAGSQEEQGEEYYRGAGRQEEQGEGYYGSASSRTGTPVGTRVRLYAAGLPMQCRLAAQYCRVFGSSEEY